MYSQVSKGTILTATLELGWISLWQQKQVPGIYHELRHSNHSQLFFSLFGREKWSLDASQFQLCESNSPQFNSLRTSITKTKYRKINDKQSNKKGRVTYHRYSQLFKVIFPHLFQCSHIHLSRISNLEISRIRRIQIKQASIFPIQNHNIHPW